MLSSDAERSALLRSDVAYEKGDFRPKVRRGLLSRGREAASTELGWVKTEVDRRRPSSQPPLISRAGTAHKL